MPLASQLRPVQGHMALESRIIIQQVRVLAAQCVQVLKVKLQPMLIFEHDTMRLERKTSCSVGQPKVHTHLASRIVIIRNLAPLYRKSSNTILIANVGISHKYVLCVGLICQVCAMHCAK